MASLCCTNETDSVGELASRKKGEDAVAGDTSEYRGRDPDLEKDKLGWGVSVRADRDPRTFGGDDAQPFHIEVLSVRNRRASDGPRAPRRATPVRFHDGPRVRIGDEAIAEGWRCRRIRRLAQPLGDEMRGERTDGPQFGQASAGFLDGGRLFGPHERGSRRSLERALLASLAAFGLERQKLRDVAVGEGRYEGVLVRVEKSHARYRRSWTGVVSTRYSIGTPPVATQR